MEKTFWHGVWERNSIGFHQDEVHPFLISQFQSLINNQDKKVFVPLCGKSLDMFFLAEHMNVIGSELSEIACQDFFSEQNIEYQRQVKGSFVQYSYQNISLLQGDFFQLAKKDIDEVDWIYDRAALIALPESMQVDYVNAIRQLMDAGTKLLLITLEFPVQELTGPPFPVTEQRVNQLFSDFQITLLAEQELSGGKFARRTFDVSYLKEKYFLIHA